NNCKLTISTFNDSTRYISGNRCERGAGKTETSSQVLPNLYAYKYRRLFAHYEPLPANKSIATIGIPRVLNMYEDYPFWFTFFHELGFRVELSTDSSHNLYTQGMESITSESICYPAKLVNGHIEDLISRGVRVIFYPSVTHEFRENQESDNHYNCPIVISYPEVVANNLDSLENMGVRYLNPFVQIFDRKAFVNTMADVLATYGLNKKDIRSAADKAYSEHLAYKEDVLRAGDEARAYMAEHQIKGIVLAGRPYHIDPEINHGIPELINGLGLAVLSEDSIARPGTLELPIRVVDQWTYHSRLYEAAAVVTEEEDLELVQLNSFGCGLDAITTDQVKDILSAKGKIYTCLKIDEISNLGAARIRLRSLLAAMREREDEILPQDSYVQNRLIFTKEMAKEYTILAPQMAPTHFAMIEAALKPSKLTLEILPKVSKEDIECGLKYVHNDA
ncbi:MAG: 2-hydroxyglutaryl-CoA dehydratase, partial [Clostridiales bacterium]|nr:2-hydroxyglutaryl-CoA dehydratase [Clostridiales bacterium]